MINKWLSHFQPAIKNRGKTLYYNDAVLDLDFEKTANGRLQVYAEIEGSQRDYYESVLTFMNDSLISARCSCPYQSYCKHCVALIHEYNDYLAEYGLPNDFMEPQADPLETLSDLLKNRNGSNAEKNVHLSVAKSHLNPFTEKHFNNYLEQKYPTPVNSKEKYRLCFAISPEDYYDPYNSFSIRPVLQYIKKNGEYGRITNFSKHSSIIDPDPYLMEIAGDLEYSYSSKKTFAHYLSRIVKYQGNLLFHYQTEYPAIQQHILDCFSLDFSPSTYDSNTNTVSSFEAIISNRSSNMKGLLEHMKIIETEEGHIFFFPAQLKIYTSKAFIRNKESVIHILKWLQENIKNIDSTGIKFFEKTIRDCPDSDLLTIDFSRLEFILVNNKAVPLLKFKKPRKNKIFGELKFDYKVPDSGNEKSDTRYIINRDTMYEEKIRNSFLNLTQSILQEKDDSFGNIRHFFHRDISQNDFLIEYAEILLDLGFEIYFHDYDEKLSAKQGKISIEVESGEDWFELDAGIYDEDNNFQKIEIDPASLESNFIRIKGELIYINKENRKILETLIEHKQAKKMVISKYDLSTIDLLYEFINKPDQQIKEIVSILKKLKNFKSISKIAPPKSFMGTLREYQQGGLNWLYFLYKYDLNGILADDMGLGKTIQTLALLSKLKEEKSLGLCLLIVPVSTITNWEHETVHFTSNLKMVRHYGPGRAKSIDKYKDADLLITSYSTTRNDITLFQDFTFCYIILDEAQNIKNHSSQTFKAIRLLKGKHRLSLTGTPVENSSLELWSQMQFLNPGLLGSLAKFKREFSSQFRQEGISATIERLKKRISPFILRRKKEEVAKDLPEKEIIPLFLEMEEDQQIMYNNLKEYYKKELLNASNDIASGEYAIKFFQGLMRLRQAACLPAVINKEYKDVSSIKKTALFELLEDIIAEDNKVLIFSQFTTVLKIIAEQLDRQKQEYCYLDGQTRKRAEVIKIFQESDAHKIFLLSIKAGGVGINLTAADYVILYDPWWNPAVESQAIDRAHRIGQQNKVIVYKLICKDTVEEKILNLQKKKQELVDKIISEDSGFYKSLNKDDIVSLFE